MTSGEHLRVKDISFQDRALTPIWDKVQEGRRLDHNDGLAILETSDITSLGKMADHVTRSKNGNQVYFVLNRQINPTNVCVLDCRFCDFAVKVKDPNSYEMTIDEILSRINDELSEVHIVGGMHPHGKFEQYLNIVKAIHDVHPALGVDHGHDRGE